MARPERCPEHGIVLNPQGECTLCVSRTQPPPPTTAQSFARFAKPLIIGILAVALLAMILYGVQYHRRRQEERAAPPPPSPMAVPADGRLRFYIEPPARQGRQARISATFSRRTEIQAARGARVTGTGEDSAYYRLEGVQTISEVDDQGRVSMYTYEVTVLRLGRTRSDSRAALTGVTVQVQPRPDGRPVIQVEGGEVLRPGGNGAWEAFVRLTPVTLGEGDEAIYGLTERRSVGDRYPVDVDALRRRLDQTLHTENATLSGEVQIVDAIDGRGTITSSVTVADARPRMRVDGTIESFTANGTERFVVPYVEEGVRQYEANVESAMQIRQRRGRDVSQLVTLNTFERYERRTIPID